jgi:hypothetical protein
LVIILGNKKSNKGRLVGKKFWVNSDLTFGRRVTFWELNKTSHVACRERNGDVVDRHALRRRAREKFDMLSAIGGAANHTWRVDAGRNQCDADRDPPRKRGMERHDRDGNMKEDAGDEEN